MKLIPMILYGALFSIAAMSHAAESDCTVASPKALVDSKLVKSGSYEFVQVPATPNVAPAVIERATLHSGTPVVIESGGCYHFGTTYDFTVPAPSTRKICSAWLKEAIGHYSALTQAFVTRSDRSRLQRILMTRVSSGKPYVCGEEIPVLEEMPDYGSVSVSTSSLNASQVKLTIRFAINP